MPYYRTPRVVGRLVKVSLTLLVLSINAILLWRVFFSAAIPGKIKTMLPNETLSSAYTESGGKLTLRYQNLSSVTRNEESRGYFGIPQCVFIPEAEQVQIVFRYNNSTLRHLARDYGLSEIPSREETLFDVTLVKTTDLTPEDPTDNANRAMLAIERFHPTGEPIRDTTSLYTYYRYVFDGVTVEDDTVGIFVDSYYVEDINYDDYAYGTLCIYFNELEWLPYQPTSADKKAMAE